MKLIDLLKALSANKALNITLIDSSEESLITFNAAGYSSVEGDLGERTVKKVTVASVNSVSVVIEDAATS